MKEKLWMIKLIFIFMNKYIFIVKHLFISTMIQYFVEPAFDAITAAGL